MIKGYSILQTRNTELTTLEKKLYSEKYHIRWQYSQGEKGTFSTWSNTTTLSYKPRCMSARSLSSFGAFENGNLPNHLDKQLKQVNVL